MLRNLLGVEDSQGLADAENDFVEFRIAELREQPARVKHTFDLAHLQALHRQLFQDVYEWAGDLRTVGLANRFEVIDLERHTRSPGPMCCSSDNFSRIGLVAEGLPLRGSRMRHHHIKSSDSLDTVHHGSKQMRLQVPVLEISHPRSDLLHRGPRRRRRQK